MDAVEPCVRWFEGALEGCFECERRWSDIVCTGEEVGGVHAFIGVPARVVDEVGGRDIVELFDDVLCLRGL